jgi:hypothetical protein
MFGMSSCYSVCCSHYCMFLTSHCMLLILLYAPHVVLCCSRYCMFLTAHCMLFTLLYVPHNTLYAAHATVCSSHHTVCCSRYCMLLTSHCMLFALLYAAQCSYLRWTKCSSCSASPVCCTISLRLPFTWSPSLPIAQSNLPLPEGRTGIAWVKLVSRECIVIQLLPHYGLLRFLFSLCHFLSFLVFSVFQRRFSAVSRRGLATC